MKAGYIIIFFLLSCSFPKEIEVTECNCQVNKIEENFYKLTCSDGVERSLYTGRQLKVGDTVNVFVKR